VQIYRYLDISMTSLGASGSLLNRIASSSSPLFKWRRLCDIARRSNSRLWKDRYSPDQRLTDMMFCRPMEFGYEIMLTRFHIWDLKLNGKINDEENITAETLLDNLLGLKEVRRTSRSDHLSLGLLSDLSPRNTRTYSW